MLDEASLSLDRCPFCGHGNTADAKFCNSCGGQLSLLPCPRCGTVNDVTMTACYHCHGPLPVRGTGTAGTALQAGVVAKPMPPRRPRVMVGILILVAAAVLGYFGYRQLPVVDAPRPAAAGGESGVRSGPSAAGVIGRDAAPGVATPAKADNPAVPASAAAPPSETPPAAVTNAPATPTNAGRGSVESREAKPAAERVSPTRAVATPKAGVQEPIRREACTEAVAALGLCESKDAAGPIARPSATDAGKAGAQEPPRQEACTEAQAALGLCKP